MGLQILEDELNNSQWKRLGRNSTPFDSSTNTLFESFCLSLIDTIKMSQDSCYSAVEICDDLLRYDTLDHEDIPLYLKPHLAVPLFYEAVKPLQLQVIFNINFKIEIKLFIVLCL